MKNVSKLVLLLIILNFSSCSNEEVIETSKTNSDVKYLKTADDQISIEDIRFENLMQWTAYLTTQVLINNDQWSEQFVSLNSNTGVIKLEDLFNDNLLNTSFIDALEVEFDNHVLQTTSICDIGARSNDRPTPPQLPGSSQSGIQILSWTLTFPVDEERWFEEYLELILDDNCLEIYLPNDYNILEMTAISSAHPLLDHNFNDLAFNHTSTCEIEYASVSDISLGNIIIVRPDRKTYTYNLLDCSYSQYPFNFTDFLD